MNFYQRKRIGKWLLLGFSLLIIGMVLYFTRQFAEKFKEQEVMKMQIWATAFEEIGSITDLDQEVKLPFQVVESNNTIPLIQTDEAGNIINMSNIDTSGVKHPKKYLEELLVEMRNEYPPLVINLPRERQYVYYTHSTILRQLEYYPILMLMILASFAGFIFASFRISKRSEQSMLWAGMAKEAAHQIGTPLSSLMGWVEILKLEEVDTSITDEIGKDIDRLQVITERFSKIGSVPELSPLNLVEVTENAVVYLRSRTSKRVHYKFVVDGNRDIPVLLNRQLYEWVIENLTKNAIDAMSGEGDLLIEIKEEEKIVKVLVSDTGKGIPKSSFQNVFQPGYTTKKRGWGLGLSLSRRIITDYHHGKIGVLKSEPGVGTTFQIVLKKA